MPENQRLFIAVFPPPNLRQALFDIARQQQLHLGGRCMAQNNLHLTLTFLGQTPSAAIPRILAQLQQMPELACELKLDMVGSFAHNGIVWAGTQSTPAILPLWVTELRKRLESVHVDFDHQPFCPHITLLRKASHKECTLDPAIVWPLGCAQLYASRPDPDGPRYEVISSPP